VTSEHEIKTVCPHCREEFPLATNPYSDSNRPPEEGDAMLCIRCTGWGIMTRTGRMRRPNEIERDMLANSKKHQEMRLALLMVKATTRR
jgi:hypothetical protein